MEQEFSAEEILQALRLEDMAHELGIPHSAMSLRVRTQRFRRLVRQIDSRPRRRTWHRGDFAAYKRMALVERKFDGR